MILRLSTSFAFRHKSQFFKAYAVQRIAKAVVAGPAGRRAPDHFFAEYAFRRVPFSAHFTLNFYSDLFNLPKFIDAIINNTRWECHQKTKLAKV